MLTPLALRFQKYAPLFLRFGLAIVFLLFGLQKLINPGQSTAEIQLLLSFELADAAALSFYFGITEIILAIALSLGIKVRFFALLSALMVIMLFISFLAKYGLSINPDLYRDVGLLGGAIALFLLGGGPYSIDNLKRKIEDE
jgi:uncharacterized membrane protein YphA (DoxX/SURF4 family)